MKTIIVGGGVAGLTCGRVLQQHGHEVVLFEASDAPGGRVRSDSVADHTLDRGFQVLFDAYPAARRHLDYSALHLRAFAPGAIICYNGRRAILTDPLREHESASVLAAGLSTVIPPLDKLRTLRLAIELRAQPLAAMNTGGDSSTLSYLRQRGFSQQTIDRFFRPFFGGIFLDRSLNSSARNFRFYFKMLSEGGTCLPTDGMGAISAQLAAPLHAAGALHTNRPVRALLRDGAHVVGVVLADGSEHYANAVVLATAAPELARLSELPIPTGKLGTTTLYFSSLQMLYSGSKLLLNAADDAIVNNAQLLSNVVPTYAPPGRHLLSVSVLGIPPVDDAELAQRVLADLRRMFAGNAYAQQVLDTQELLAVYRIPFAQFVQLPGVHRHLPRNATPIPGLWLASEITASSSINGAMQSGEDCATALHAVMVGSA